MQKKGSYSNYDGKDFGRILEFCPVVLPHSPHAVNMKSILNFSWDFFFSPV